MKTEVMKNALRETLKTLILPLALVGVIEIALVLVVGAVLGVRLGIRGQVSDLGFTLMLATPLLLMNRNRIAGVLTVTLILAVLHVGNALKIALLGGPVLPDDIFAARALFFIMKPWQAVLGGSIVLLLILSFCSSLTLRPLRAKVGAAFLCAMAGTIVLVPAEKTVAFLDWEWGNSEWNQRHNYQRRGPLLYLLHEGSRIRATRPRIPDASEVRTAFESLVGPVDQMAPVTEPPAQRTLVVVLLESFFDPSVLKSARFSRDPFHENFRSFWEKTGNSRALSPVFGGYTANAEFEVLCGFPVTMDAVFFEKGLIRDVPCLPRLLSGAGYTTIASHPNIPVFWNRVHAYRRLGFDIYRSKDDFHLDDLNGEYLSDTSLYRQVLDHVGPLIDEGKPTFSYVVTFFGHYEYPLNEIRDTPVRVGNGDKLLENYANTVYNKSKELMDFIGDIQARDPDALIVAFGDHLPLLGANFAAYTDSGILEANRADFTDSMFLTVSATPLIVVDGKRGPLNLGDLPLYYLPSLIRTLMGKTGLTLVDLTVHTPGDIRIRPLPGMSYALAPPTQTGAPPVLTVCRSSDTDPENCRVQDDWLEAVGVLTRDVFSGHQETLRLLPSRPHEPEKRVTHTGTNTPASPEEADPRQPPVPLQEIIPLLDGAPGREAENL